MCECVSPVVMDVLPLIAGLYVCVNDGECVHACMCVCVSSQH